METLINHKNLPVYMSEVQESTRLEEKIPELLSRAISFIPKKGRAIVLYEGDVSYIVFSSGIQKDWTDKHPNGGAVTRWEDVTRDEFLQWVNEQPEAVQEEVRKNLQDYISTETPKERGKEEFPESKYLLGY